MEARCDTCRWWRFMGMETSCGGVRVEGKCLKSGRVRPEGDACEGHFPLEITAEEFERMTGCEPEGDDLERANCEREGEIGHWLCGVCETHYKPRTDCGCMARRSE